MILGIGAESGIFLYAGLAGMIRTVYILYTDVLQEADTAQ